LQATHDVLTGLPNRALFNDLVNRQIAISALAGTHFSVLYIDLDGFKPVNDIHGHAAGDAILCGVAGRLRSELRESDMAARLGGDEFAVILVGTPGSAAAQVANNLIRTVSKPYDFKKEVVRISASIGVAGYPEAGAVDHELLRMADLAMYEAKNAGKGQVICAGTKTEYRLVTIKLSAQQSSEYSKEPMKTRRPSVHARQTVTAEGGTLNMKDLPGNSCVFMVSLPRYTLRLQQKLMVNNQVIY
jgi:diguanylate cyclase (GGDEF)-like protein